MNQKAREVIYLKFNFYKPKEYHPEWKQLNIEAARLALNIAKNSQLKSKYLQGTLLQKRKILAIMKIVIVQKYLPSASHSPKTKKAIKTATETISYINWLVIATGEESCMMILCILF